METVTQASGRGRPKKPDSLTNAERQKRYRDKAKQSGQVKRYVTENRDIEDENGYINPTHDELRAMYVENMHKLMDAQRTIVYLKEKADRLQQKNDQLHSDLATETSLHTATYKELRMYKLRYDNE